MWYVYIIQCRDRKLYTGITTNIARRLSEHNSGHGGHFTRFRKPVKLVYWQWELDKSKALKEEAKIKKLKKKEKLDLLEIFKNWRKINETEQLQWETADKWLRRSMNVPPIKKLERLRQFQKFISRYSAERIKKIRPYLEIMR